MHAAAPAILLHLDAVATERERRSSIHGLAPKVVLLKAFQQRRFAQTYADLLRSPRYGPASRFFLDELYGPSDFSQRDAQFVRVVPALVRLFPAEIVDTVAILAELHAMSETLDSAMAIELPEGRLTREAYVHAWQRTGRAECRDAQIALTVEVAGRLDRLTRNPLLRNGLRLMRAPAGAAGLSDLQRFLEMGFDTFRAMKGAQDFIAIVRSREAALASALFSAQASLGGSDGDNEGLKAAAELLPYPDEQ